MIGAIGIDALGPTVHREPFDFLFLALLPALVSPIGYLAGFAYLELAVPDRTRRTRVVSALLCGTVQMLLLLGAWEAGAALGPYLAPPGRLVGSAFLLLCLLGPVVLGVAAARVEPRVRG